MYLAESSGARFSFVIAISVSGEPGEPTVQGDEGVPATSTLASSLRNRLWGLGKRCINLKQVKSRPGGELRAV